MKQITKYILSATLTAATIISPALAQNNLVYNTRDYIKELKNTINQNKDIDWSHVGDNYHPQFDSFHAVKLNDYPQEGVKISPVALTHLNIRNAFGARSELLLEDWNKYTTIYGQAINTCDVIYNNISEIEKYIGGNILMEKNGNSILLTKDDYINIVACFVKNEHNISQQINTGYESYRKHNIGTGLKNFNNRVWQDGERLPMYSNIFDGKSKYVTGKALRLNKNNKVEDFDVYGGGTCGISTVFYQNGLKTFGIDVEQRQPHSNYYVSYYGKTIGLDATIFGWANGKATVDLVMKNNTGKNLYMTTYDYSTKGKYHYGVNFYAPFIKRNQIKQETEKAKGGSKCYVNTITKANGEKKTIRSCYKNVY